MLCSSEQVFFFVYLSKRVFFNTFRLTDWTLHRLKEEKHLIYSVVSIQALQEQLTSTVQEIGHLIDPVSTAARGEASQLGHKVCGTDSDLIWICGLTK